MNSPYEAYASLVSLGDELRDTLTLLLGVELSPLVSVVGIILGAIDVSIELGAPIELELLDAVAMALRVAVESLDDASESHTRIVSDLTVGEPIGAEELSQTL